MNDHDFRAEDMPEGGPYDEQGDALQGHLADALTAVREDGPPAEAERRAIERAEAALLALRPVRPLRWRHYAWASGLIAASLAVAAGVWVYPAYQAGRSANNLRQLGLASHNFHSVSD